MGRTLCTVHTLLLCGKCVGNGCTDLGQNVTEVITFDCYNSLRMIRCSLAKLLLYAFQGSPRDFGVPTHPVARIRESEVA